MKMTALDNVTRRKLIKLIRRFGESYYIFSDGSNHLDEAAIKASLEFWDKKSLSSVVRILLDRGHFLAADRKDTSYLLELATILAMNGILPLQSWELPSESALAMMRREILFKMAGVLGTSVPEPTRFGTEM